MSDLTQDEAALVPLLAIPGLQEVVLGVLIVGLVGTLAYQVYNAQQQSQALKPSDQAQPCVECGEIPCFEVPDGGDPAEMARQLKDQEDLINSQSPDDMQKRLDAAAQRKKNTGSYRPEGDSADRTKARENYRRIQTEQLTEQYEAENMDPDEALAKAQQEVANKMATMDATHALDSIVGGNEDDQLGMGDSKTNRSIGSQWRTRVQALKDAVKNAKKAGKEKMDVKLEPCEPDA